MPGLYGLFLLAWVAWVGLGAVAIGSAPLAALKTGLHAHLSKT